MQWSRLLLASVTWSVVGSLQVTIFPQLVQKYFQMIRYDVGLAPGAVLGVNITNALPSNGTVLVVLSRQQWREWLLNQLTPLPVNSLGPDNHTDHAYSSYLVTNWRQPLVSRLVAKYTLRATKPDRYYIGVLNVHREVLLIAGTISYENPGGQQLPLQLVHLPDLLWVSSLAFAALMLAAILLLSLRRDASLLHALLCGCVGLKSIDLLLHWKYFYVLSRDGISPLWRKQTWQFVSKLHEVFQIGLLLVTALGWRMLRPRLTSIEIRFAMLAISLALLLAALQVGSESAESDVNPVSFRLLFYIVKVMCYLVIIFAMNFNLQVINVHLAESPVTAAVAVFYRKQEAFMSLRRIFLALVFRPSVLLWLQLSVLNKAETEWLVPAINEVWGWCIYLGLFIALWPTAGNRLVRLVLGSQVHQFGHFVADIGMEQAGRQVSPGRQRAAAAEGPWVQAAAASAVDEAVANTAVGNLDGDITAPYIPLAGGD